MTESFITQLQNQGVDVSSVQTALQNNDMASVNSWLKSYFEAHPGTFGNATPMHRGAGFKFNATAQQAHLQSFITNLQNQGVDVSSVQTALQNNDTATVNTWLKSYFEAHPGTFGNATHMHSGAGFKVNATAQQAHLQSFITSLQNKGVDVSSVQTALQNNDTATVNAWLKSYFEAHPGTFGNATHMQRSYGFTVDATTQQAHLQSFITNLQNQGVDVSSVQTALQNNDMATVNSWLTSYRVAHPGAFGNVTQMHSGAGFKFNATTQQAHLQSFITSLQNKGVDVSSVQAALQNNDTATVNAWLKSYFETHPGTVTNSTRPHWHQWNSTATQSS